MNEKEMIKHINDLTKIIAKQADYCEQLTRKFYNMDRQISVLSFAVGKLQGMKKEDD